MDLSSVTSVKLNIDGNVGIVTLNRPDRLNAIDSATIGDLDRVFAEIAINDAVRAVVITGAGRAFCAGADVQEWSEGDKPDDEAWPPKMHRFMSRLYWLPKPVIAAVNGVAVGAGCDITLTADIRIASTAARFGEVYMRLGFCPDAGGSFLLPRIVGESRAAEMIYTGRIIEAAEADSIGLVSEVVSPDELLPRAMEVAGGLAAGPTTAIGIAKQNLRHNSLVSFDEALRIELRGGELCGKTADHVEGLKATVEKRQPKFVGH
ncbi:enoyl-CoA hydratase/isomerase family protein [Nakamurella lactea]|uniref:enoyl-CoA hydratase/isomerase family protein n=1 Tax=Nakamurella lactea TaxID=459515 RepID=UPI000418AF2A|nr:enoyl-CoA hydratase-related protein [Nakamurella lactea]